MNKEPEQWVDIVGYEGLYSISNLGRIASHHRDEFRILHPATHKTNGYSYVDLCRNGIRKSYRVHVLVAKHFIPKPEGQFEINHKDEDKSNNRVDNLEWCTKSYNINYGTRIKRQRVKMCKPVVQYNKTGKYINSHESVRQASQTTGISAAHIVRCCKKTNPLCVWVYLEIFRGGARCPLIIKE